MIVANQHSRISIVIFRQGLTAEQGDLGLQALGNVHNLVRGDIETALAHVVPNKVEAAYARSDLFERRRG